MDPIRPLAGITVVLVFGTGVVTGVQLSHNKGPASSTAAPVPSPSSLNLVPPARVAPPPPVIVETPAPQTPPPQSSAPQSPVALPPAVATPRLPPRAAMIRRPAAPTPAQRAAQVARARAAQRHAEAYARLRRQAILLCREWGFSQARCDTAPR
jgi:hypothetical protein